MKKFNLILCTLIATTLLTITATADIPNGSFETGTLTNWTLVGNGAFGDSPRSTPRFGQPTEGIYYADSGYDASGVWVEMNTGTLQSANFTLDSSEVIQFSIGGWSKWGGGGFEHCYVGLYLADNDSELDRAWTPNGNSPVQESLVSGTNIDVEVYIKVVDDGATGGFAWLTVDNFRTIDTTDPNFDFEYGYMNWTTAGLAWGAGPVTTNWVPVHFAGNPIHLEYYANSMLGGEINTGTIKSINFTYPTDGSVKFLIGGHSTHWTPEVYNYVAIKDASTHAEYGRVYAPDQNYVTERAITNAAANGKEVYIEVVDNCSSGGWAWISVDYFQIDTPMPDTPTGVEATKGSTNDRVIITWNLADSADKYRVFRNTVADTNTATDISGELDEFDTVFDDITAENNTNYYYWVQAGNAYGWSPFSDYDTGFTTDSTGPDKPLNVSPAEGATPEFPISLAASEYSDSESWPFIESQWQISAESDFSPKKTLKLGAVTNVSPFSGDLYTGTNFWRVRYLSDRNQWSDWSDSTVFIVDRNIDSKFYFYDTFNNVSGSGNINKEYTISGRQFGSITPLDYATVGNTIVGMSAGNVNKLTMSGASACSPNYSFENSGDFMIEVDMQPTPNGTAVGFGKISQNDVKNTGGMGFIFYGDGSGKYEVYSSDVLVGIFTNDAVKASDLNIIISASTENFQNETAYVAMTVNGTPVTLRRKWWAPAAESNIYYHMNYFYTYVKNNGFDKNYITLQNFGGNAIVDDLKITTIGSKLSIRTWENDDDFWIGTTNAVTNFTHAVNLNWTNMPPTIDITGLGFENPGRIRNPVNLMFDTGQPETTGSDWSLFGPDGWISAYGGDYTPMPAAEGDKIAWGSVYGWGSSFGIILSNLVPDSINVFTLYGRSYRAFESTRISYVSGSDGGLFEVDENLAPTDVCQIVEYEYTASADGTFIITLTPIQAQDYLLSGFSSYLKEIPEPKIEVEDSFDFGEILISGGSINKNLYIFNSGAGVVEGTISDIDVGSVFTLATNYYFAENGAPANISINFNPTEEIAYSDTITLTGTGTNGPVYVELKGTGVPEPISVIGYLLSVVGLFLARKK